MFFPSLDHEVLEVTSTILGDHSTEAEKQGSIPTILGAGVANDPVAVEHDPRPAVMEQGLWKPDPGAVALLDPVEPAGVCLSRCADQADFHSAPYG